MTQDELNRLAHGRVKKEAERGDNDRAEVHPKYLVKSLDSVSFEKFLLECSGETIKAKVADHECNSVKNSKRAFLAHRAPVT